MLVSTRLDDFEAVLIAQYTLLLEKMMCFVDELTFDQLANLPE